ncbi:MAG: right-handed parallel beta-helix repeat-containing protein, partial [Deltaproteobacteria bacterium]|nr:right-handed parallel beta-helix repeat-containing protein [Deltaproteobacteria bacterium]
FPNLAKPQDLVGGLGIDLDFSNAGKCKYRSRNDSLVVSWNGVRGWNTTAWYNFQILLTRADSSIKLQYNRIDPAFPAANASIGIENNNGTVGLSYYNNGAPAGNLPAAGRAVRIYPPAGSSYTSTDAGAAWALNPQSGAVVVHTLDLFQPRVAVANFGTGPVVIPRTICRIRNAAGTVVYADTILNLALATSQQQDTAFVKTFNPTVAGTYTLVVRTEGLAESPANPANDSVIVELPVVAYQSWLRYDDNTAEAFWAWSGASATSQKGFGQYFELSRYPVMVDSAQVYINYRNKDAIYIQVYDATGPGGGPGTLLATDTIRVNGNNQYKWIPIAYTTRNITIATGKFFICVKTSDPTVRFGLDQSSPISRRTWEFTGSWTPYRGLESQDVMIRANVHKPNNSAIYVDAVTGSDLNPGTSALPLKTMTHAVEVISSTDTCYARSGSYNGRLTFTPRHSGTAANRTVVTAQAGHTPLLFAGGADGSLIDSAASYITFNGFTIYPGSVVSAYFQDATQVRFTNNRIYVPTMGYGLLAVSLTSSLIKGNTVGPAADNINPAEGVYLWGTDQVRIDSNRISGMIDAGMVLDSDTRTTVCRNLSDHCFFGIDLWGSSGDSLYNNTFDGHLNSGIHVQNLSGTLVIRNTNSTNSIYGICWDSTGAVSSDYNNIWNNTYNYKNPQLPGDTNIVAPGAHDISADPLYTAAYHLLSTSPCRNAGIPVGLPYQGTAPDIGAYEDWAKFLDVDGAYPGVLTPQFGLKQNRPNPFNRTTTIAYQLPAAGEVCLKVYNIAGQLVRTLVDQRQSSGPHAVSWDGRDGQGRQASAGVYHYRLVSGGRALTRSLLYVK